MTDPSEPVSHVRRAGLVFDVTDSGAPDGDLVVLLHGFPQDSSCWEPLVPVLTDAGYRTVAPDQRGYSPLARPRGRASYRTRELVEDVLAVADAAGADRFHLVGHDHGAYVAWSLASHHPDRLASLTALSVPHPAALRDAALHGQALRSWYMAAFQVPGLAERLVRPDTRGWDQLTRGLPRESIRRYAERMSDPATFAAALDWYRALPSELRHPSAPATRVTVPTLFVWGARDPALGRWAAEHTGDHVSGDYRFLAITDAGHWLPETRALAMAPALLDHLAAHPVQP